MILIIQQTSCYKINFCKVKNTIFRYQLVLVLSLNIPLLFTHRRLGFETPGHILTTLDLIFLRNLSLYCNLKGFIVNILSDCTLNDLSRWILHDRTEGSQTPHHRAQHEPLLRLTQGRRPFGPVLLATRGPGQVS